MSAMTDAASTTSPNAQKARSPELALYGLFALCVACALLLLSLPRAIAPTEFPSLTLSAADVALAIRDDARLAASAPNSPAARELNSRFAEFGATELAAIEDARLSSQRRRLLHHLFSRVVAESGEASALALRSLALSKFEAALDARLPADQVPGTMGIFANVLSEHRATRDGEELAPHFVLRTLYKARWNVMLELEPDFRMTRVERRAYFGWLGMHAENLPLGRRREALLKYAAVGGPNALEAVGVLAFLDHDFQHAKAALERAYAAAPSLRLRNYIRGVSVAETLSGEPTAISEVPSAPAVARVPPAPAAP